MRVLDRLRRADTPEAPVLPYLRPGTWDMVYTCAHRSLLTYRPGPDVPFVVCGKDAGDGVDLIRHDALDALGMSWSELEAFATDNLAAVPAAWQVVHRDEGTERPVLLAHEGDGVASASRILDGDFLRQGHRAIDSSTLLVSMPSTRQIFLADGSPFAPRDLAAAFRTWTRRHHEAAAGVDALSTQVFVLREGRLVGTWKPPAER